ncbi:hypothetical protein CYLTODRAFT_487867 [Cylindrobasidium torrendii FP15055 ss-10]|uniref:F-box domain-containing protein n=1 Tax=Cylindrobasidium torrendii FP15055 ss-10 TaxID=1314674 RepID=A0A0D7BJS9_9AGAR|nr:hypothetical protein CYLTODRAFT_487867 [Cylindrobasidium torrendii FP15055 ss-10]
MITSCHSEIPTNSYPSSYAKASPFNKLLVTNDIPEDEEIRRVKHYLAAPYRRSRDIQQRVHGLVAELNALKQEHADLDTKYLLGQHRSILSPLRSLPSELLQEIFMLCVPKPCIISSKEAPLRLGQVCSRWRSIALQTPKLWSNLHVVVPGQFGVPLVPQRNINYDRFRLAFSEWMARTSNHSLQLSIFCRGNERAQDPPDIASYEPALILRDILQRYAPRCESLNLMITPVLSKMLLSDFQCDNLPLLETLYVDFEVPLNAMSFVNVNEVDMAPSETFPILNQAPRLRRVSYTSHSIRYTPPDISKDFPLAQLTHLQLSSSRGLCECSADLVSILSQCPELIYFRLWGPTSRSTTFAPSTPAPAGTTRITLPRLRTLEIHLRGQRTDNTNLPDFFDAAHMPALETLIVGTTPCRSPQQPNPEEPAVFCFLISLRQMLEQTAPPLRNLRFLMPHCCLSELVVECLPFLPHIRNLEFKSPQSKYQFYQLNEVSRDTAYAQALLQRLACPPIVCPHLESLALEDFEGLETEILEALYLARAAPQGALRCVDMSTMHPPGHPAFKCAIHHSEVQTTIKHMKRPPDALWHHTQHTGRGMVDLMPMLG